MNVVRLDKERQEIVLVPMVAIESVTTLKTALSMAYWKVTMSAFELNGVRMRFDRSDRHFVFVTV